MVDVVDRTDATDGASDFGLPAGEEVDGSTCGKGLLGLFGVPGGVDRVYEVIEAESD